MKNNHTPEIRFPGFTGDWEQRKVIDFSEETFGGGTPKTSIKEYWNGEIPWIQSSDLCEHQVSDVFAKKKITEKGLQNSAAKLIPENSIAIVTRVGVGKIALMQFEYATSQDFLSLGNLKVNEWFGVYSLYNQLQKELQNVQGTSIKGITKNELLNKKINIPTNLEEQKNIGEYLNKIDQTIALHQQELTTLKQTKQGFLQKMFPKEGGKVPEVRFPGFTDDWEQRKLDKILKERKVKQKISKEVPLLAFAAGQGVIYRSERKTNNRDFLTKDSTEKTYLLTKYDDIVYNPSNLKYGAIDRNKHGQGVISPIYVTFETDEIPSFIELIVKSENFKQRALQYEEGTVTKRQSVKPENLLCLNVVLPNSKGEQIKIGNFFKQLDDTIALHQRELDALKETKKAFLQKMFA